MGRFKLSKPPVPLTGEAFKKLTPRDCQRLQIPLDQSVFWEVVERDPRTGIAKGVRSIRPHPRDADGNLLLVPYPE